MKSDDANRPTRSDDPSGGQGISQALHEQLCEYVFGEMTDSERRSFENELEGNTLLAEEHARLTATLELVAEVPADALSDDIRATLRAAARSAAGGATERPSAFTLLRGGGRVGVVDCARRCPLPAVACC